MNIDMAALRSLEREKDVSFDLLVEAIESALLIAYQRTEGANAQARVHLDRSSGEVTVWPPRSTRTATRPRVRRHPHDFNRIAATTAKQIILQRLRDAEHELTFGEYAGREGDIVAA
jgi:N utilization substance protein A